MNPFIKYTCNAGLFIASASESESEQPKTNLAKNICLALASKTEPSSDVLNLKTWEDIINHVPNLVDEGFSNSKLTCNNSVTSLSSTIAKSIIQGSSFKTSSQNISNLIQAYLKPLPQIEKFVLLFVEQEDQKINFGLYQFEIDYGEQLTINLSRSSYVVSIGRPKDLSNIEGIFSPFSDLETPPYCMEITRPANSEGAT